jgi:5-methyltetrahydrofolate--homocysteine methyltransferase
MTPDEFSRHMRAFIEQDGVSIIGGCCGTTPGHIRHLAAACRNLVPAAREVLR